MSEQRLGLNINDLKDNEPVPASVGGKDFAVVKVDGKIHVLDGKCTHHGGPLGEGHIDNGKLICPWHSGAFDINTGKADENTSWVTDINVYNVRVDSTNGDIYVEL